MNTTSICRIIAIFLLLAASAVNGYATPATGLPSSQTAAAQSVPSTTTMVVDNNDSGETREKFRSLLQRHPPELGMVLKLDPTLLTNQSYLQTYPALAAFIAEHPEVAHSPSFFLESVWVQGDRDRESSSVRVWRDMMEGLAMFSVFLIVTSILAWLVKTMIEQRRWSRLSRVQTEVHNKLLDRFASNEDLLAYIQTPVGRRFLESAPIPVESGPRAVSAPIGRILWSVQIGLVLAAGGLGLLYVGGGLETEVGQPLSAMGVVAVCVGAGFVLSGFVSFLLSRRLGLWESPTMSGGASHETSK